MNSPRLIPLLLSVLATNAFCGLFAQAGSLDLSFDGDGKVTTDFMSTGDEASAVALQADGKIVTVGYVTVTGGFADFAVMRHLPDGSLDPGFSDDGRQATDILSASDNATSVAIQSDDRIVASGYAYGLSGNLSSVVVRYLTDGTPDPSFDGDGLVVVDYTFGDFNESGANVVAIQPDGKIVAAGGAAIGDGGHFALFRLNTNGSLDNSFGIGGKVTTDLVTGNGACLAIAIQPDARIVVAGFSYDGTEDDLALARYNTDGSPDDSFGIDGKVITELGPGGGMFRGMALQPDGKIVVAGTVNYGDFALVRYNSDGTLDTGFDGDGMVSTAVGVLGEARSLALQPDGRIVVAGFANNGMDTDFAVARYNSDGTLDTAFSSDGMVLTDMGPYEEANSVVLQPDGKILVAGFASNGVDVDFTLVRYLSGLDVGLIDLSGHDRSVFVYPNPMEEEAVLQYALSTEETISIRLLDLHGSVLHTFIEDRVQGAGEHQQKIALPEGLASGAYMIVVSSLTGQVSIRIVR